jgi:hypothetical protein
VDYKGPCTEIRATLVGVELDDGGADFIIFSRLNLKSTYRFSQGLPYVFIPLGCLGLMRLPAVLWLSGDYEYSNVSETGNGSRRNVADSPTVTKEGAGEALVDLDPHTSERTNTTVTRTPTNVPHSSEPAVFTSPCVRPHPTALACLYRVWSVLSITSLLSGSASTCHMLWSYPRSFPYVSLSHLIFNLTYFIITTMAILITNTYILLGHMQSTLICAHDLLRVARSREHQQFHLGTEVGQAQGGKLGSQRAIHFILDSFGAT